MQDKRVAGAGPRGLMRVLMAGTALTLAGAGMPAMAQAQNVAVSAQQKSFTIRRQPLPEALTIFGRQAGIQVSTDAAAVRGLTSPGVSGTMTADAAIARLLSGTGLSWRFAGPSTIVVSQEGAQGGTVSADGSVVLDTINVEGQISGAFGEENRFVAADASAATKIDAPINETPASISVVTRDQIETRDAQNMVDTLTYAPGVTYGAGTTDRRNDATKFSVRGFNVPVIVDGNRVFSNLSPTNYSANLSLDPYLLERVEVLGGPASTLYGQASPGGAILFQSKRPTATPFHEVVVGTGNYGRIQGGFDFGGPIDEAGTLLYRLTGVGLNTGTQVDFQKDQRLAIAPAITWAPDDDTTLTILASYTYDPAKIGFSAVPWVGSYEPGPLGRIPRHFFWGEPDYNDFEKTQATAGLELEHRFNDVFTVRQNMKYVYIDGMYRDMYPNALQPDGHTIGRSFFGTDDTFRNFNSDTQLEANFDVLNTNHKVLAGLDYLNAYNYNPRYIQEGSTPIDIFHPIYGNYTQPTIIEDPFKNGISQTGIYLQDYVTAGPWRILAGIRQDWADTWTQWPVDDPKSREKSDAFTWRLGASYVFDNGFAPYASYSTSFEPQGGTTAVERGRQPFKPTTGQQFEIGLKYQPPGLESFFTLSAFNITQQNVLTADPEYPNNSIQDGEVRSRGITASATLSLTSNVNLLASYTYLDLARTKASPDDSGQVVGAVPWFAPKNIASLWVDYTFDSGALDGLRLGGGVRYIGSGYIDSSETYKMPAYTLVDLGLAYDFGARNTDLKGLEAQFNVSNLFDKQYLTTCTRVNGSCYWGDGRRITGQLKYRW